MEIAVVYPKISRGMGGIEFVVENALECLSDDNEVVFYSVFPEKFEENFSDELKEEGEFRSLSLPFSYVPLRDSERLQLVKDKLIHRFIGRELEKASKNFDCIFLGSKIFSGREFDCTTIQYIHNPAIDFEREENRETWKKGYDWFLDSIVGSDTYDADLNLFNSEFTKSTYTRLGGEVLNPPVKSDFSGDREKKNQAICLGRISPDKRIEESIEIIEGTDLNLVVAGRTTETNKDYVGKLQEMANERGWLELRTDLPREELVRSVEESKIGIISKKNEHFGIAAVEYLKAGVLPMVRNEGGVKSIVQKERFTYTEVQEAREKILENLENLEDLQDFVVERGKDFSEERFRRNLKEKVENL